MAKTGKTTPEMKLRYARLYEREYSLAEVAAECGVSSRTVRYHLGRAGILRSSAEGVRIARRKQVGWSEEKQQQAEVLYARGYSMREVGEAMGVTHQVIYNHLPREMVRSQAESNKLRSKRIMEKKVDLVRDVIRLRFDEYLSTRKVARRLGIHQSDVCKYIRWYRQGRINIAQSPRELWAITHRPTGHKGERGPETLQTERKAKLEVAHGKD